MTIDNTPSARSLVTASALVCLLSLSACAARPGNDVLQTVPNTVLGARIVEVQAITTRERASADANDSTTRRSPQTNYAGFRVSVPPKHVPGNIEWPSRTIDPARQFAVVRQTIYPQDAFFDRVAGQSRNGNVTVFVHGYNQTFPEALFRATQLAADAGMDDQTVLFAWPSDGTLVGYVADRDSAAFSRDALASTLQHLASDPRIREVTLVAHSLGGWLAMEAIRQLRLVGEDPTLDRIRVILAAPDIDLDLFERQIDVIGPLDPPLTLLVASDDQALQASNRLGGQRTRVGALDVNDSKVTELARTAGIAVIDISQVAPVNDPLNHNRLAALASLSQSIDIGDEPGAIRQTGAFVFNTVGATLSAPFDLAGQALAGRR